MNLADLNQIERQNRMNIRNFFLIATKIELFNEIRHRAERRDVFAIKCLVELIDE